MFKELSKEEKSRQRWKGREAYADIPINYSKKFQIQMVLGFSGKVF
jgi:hypothetical protein